jgi:hypothetical protein
MGVVTIYRLAEQALRLIEGGAPSVASSLTFNEIKIACGQVINGLLKTEHFSINEKMGEKIPNGTTLGLYEDIDVVSYNGKSKASLPIKPLKLPRNMGIYAIYPKFTGLGSYELDKEFIPLQMGQGGLVKSQPLINDLMGQVGYENFGMDLIFTKDLKTIYPEIKLAMRLAIMDINLYGDYDPLPILPEQEWQVVNEVYKVYATQVVPDKLVDPTVEEAKNIPTTQQKASQ